MRKNITVLAAGIAASMLMIHGCSSGTAEETTTQVTTEVSAETESLEESAEAAGEESQENAEAKASGEEASDEHAETEGEENGEEMMSEIGIDVPIKIFGEIQEVAEASLTVDNQAEVSSPGEMILLIDPEHTLILDGTTGLPTSLEEVNMGSFEAYLGPAMALSLPPQTVPSVVVVNLPEDAPAPQYVVAADVIMETEDGRILAGNDGIQYPLADEVAVEPFKTRNIVTMEDIHEGSRCLVWMKEDGTVERLALMAE